MKRTVVGWVHVRRCMVVVKTQDYRSEGSEFEYSSLLILFLYCNVETEWISVFIQNGTDTTIRTLIQKMY